ncbi:CPBP family intramembrane metalloprotease [Fibrella aquatilis]|uniref:CPBP family intramembrane metalloprotease n=1 Tax=Fibrella aquatilis TaxID=2817059 RepID=A0A939JXH7_9BACT|nr:CPBP family intramembrane metalloprotease [Fibrella aquatilis]MBO0931044.1 CPBP family intramembrane metalloprotease [Fibrella aquatilis]
MTELLRDIRAYLRADFKLALYALTALWVAVLIAINYTLHLENGLIDAQPLSPWRPVWYFGMYATAYYGAFWLWSQFHHRLDIWRNPRFWLHTLVALVVFSYYAGFAGYVDWAQQFSDYRLYLYAYKVFSNLHSILTIVLPLGLYYLFVDKNQSGFYGLKPKRKGLLVYLMLLGLMVPIILFASFQPDFLEAYPTYRNLTPHEALHVPEWLTAFGYELAYGWDFVPTELIFRGFLIIGLSYVLRTGSPQTENEVTTQPAYLTSPAIAQRGLARPGPVLPMIVWYATIHFGRPLGETISSLFGGYILGVLAVSTRSIWGGLFIHIGIAWLMEAAAFWQLH